MIASRKRTIRSISAALLLMLCLSLAAPIAFAEEEGSPYIMHYTTNMTAGGNGNVTIWFHITGTGMMEQIGSTRITLYENGIPVRVYTSASTSGMMAQNNFSHGSSITYAGTAGRTYSAFVTFHAGRNGGWDNRSMDTNTVTAW
jgi:hypothetical protein